MEHTNDLAVGIDVGGTHLRALLVDSKGGTHASAYLKLKARDPKGLLASIDEALRALGERPKDLPIGIGLCGQLHVRRGIVAIAPNLGWRDVPFGSMLTEHFGQKVRLVNDLNAITVGEQLVGAGGGAAHVACVFVGTGVGMGAVSHGILIEGHDGLATELGHVKVRLPPVGRACGCGEGGCLEAHTSGRHLPELLAVKYAAGCKGVLGTHNDSTPVAADTIELAARKGEEAAVALWDEVGDDLGRAIGACVTLLNFEVLILGGGVLASAPGLKARVITGIRAYAAQPALQSLRIVDTVLGERAGATGAAMLARQAEEAPTVF